MYFGSRKREGVANIKPSSTAAEKNQEKEYLVENLIKDFEKKLGQETDKRKRKEKIGRGRRLRTFSKSAVTPSCSSEIDNIDHVNDISKTIQTEKIAEKIIGVYDNLVSGQLVFLMKWRGIEEADLIPAEETKSQWSQIVIQYYVEHLIWKSAC
ncbi:chromobox protein homolog 5-like [Acyrthosiphon pisum]|uniref:Chromo domain-containing protein n=1 Tax=Acyrthosiphon pisum TaxID=7029 RepID=A0A8R2B4I3_ACYPI|nr:chromobox protein homolog 5-like [Acyrthosiphon pisum]|eukprot:XP_008181351.1 PREDICTED: chromobox protein homolog 5-like [Acyrthosiphon pisum]